MAEDGGEEGEECGEEGVEEEVRDGGGEGVEWTKRWERGQRIGEGGRKKKCGEGVAVRLGLRISYLHRQISQDGEEEKLRPRS